MRRYHPDADSSDEAAAQARAINLAYAALGDAGRRSAYDRALGLRAALKFEPVVPRKPKKAWPAQLGSAAAIGVALVAAVMVAYALIPRDRQQQAGGRGTNGKQLVAASAPEGHISTKPAEVKRLITSASLSPTAAVAGAAPQAARSSPVREETPKAKTKTFVAEQSPQSDPTIGKCSGIAKRADRMVCSDENLTSLDRQLSLLYNQSWAAANERKRMALLGTRHIFNDRRDDCETPNCLTSTYVVRLKEISDIMAGRTPR